MISATPRERGHSMQDVGRRAGEQGQLGVRRDTRSPRPAMTIAKSSPAVSAAKKMQFSSRVPSCQFAIFIRRQPDLLWHPESRLIKMCCCQASCCPRRLIRGRGCHGGGHRKCRRRRRAADRIPFDLSTSDCLLRVRVTSQTRNSRRPFSLNLGF